MSLELILLGMLREPAAGYDLHKAFDSGPRHFWAAELSQIYPALQAMEKRGWLSSRRAPSARGPARRIYERTAAGTKALHEWLGAEPEIGDERAAYIGQLVFLAEWNDARRTLRLLESLRKKFVRFRERLEVDEAALRRARPRAAQSWSPDDFHELLCLRMGIRAMQGKIDGCNECMRLVRARHRSKGGRDDRS